MKTITKYVSIAVSAVALLACQGQGNADEIFSGADPIIEEAAGPGASDGNGVPAVEAASLDDESSTGVDGSENVDLTIEDFNSVIIGDPVEYEIDRNAGADFSAAELSDTERASVFDAYDAFLAGADTVRLEGESGDPDLAASGLVDDRLADYEEELAADFGRIEDVTSFANVERVSGSAAEWVVVEDCMEVSITTSINVVSSDFVRQDVWLEPDGDGWAVTAIDVMHDGSLRSADELGCVPRRYAAPAEAVTAEFLRLRSAGTDVDVGALAEVTTEEYFEVVADEQPDASRSTSAPDDVVVSMLGHNSFAGTRTLYLEACVTTADGVSHGTYEVTRGLLNGFPDFGDDLDVYAVSDGSPSQLVDACPIGSGS